jgi:hypothetical protein
VATKRAIARGNAVYAQEKALDSTSMRTNKSLFGVELLLTAEMVARQSNLHMSGLGSRPPSIVTSVVRMASG